MTQLTDIPASGDVMNIPSSEQIIDYLQSVQREANAAISVAHDTAMNSANQEEAIAAVTTLYETINSLYSAAESQALTISGIMDLTKEIQRQRDEIFAQVEELQDSIETKVEERASDLADALTKAEVEHLMECDTCRDSNKVAWIAERMIDEGVEEVENELREEFEEQLRRAKKLVKQVEENGFAFPFDDEADDDTEADAA